MSARPRARLVDAVVRHPWRVVVAWVVVLLALLPLAGGAERRLDVAARVPGSESERVAQILARDFASAFAEYAVLVVDDVPPPSTTEGARVLEEVVRAVGSAPGVLRTFSWLDARDSVFLARTGTFVIAGLARDAGPVDAVVPRLREVSARTEAALRARHPRARLLWTGESVLNHDLRVASAEDAASAERRVLPLTAALLLVGFGSIVAALLPVAVGFVSIVLATGLLGLVAMRWPISVLALNVVSMLGLGLGIDYALLVVSRFREARRDGAGVPDAATQAARRAGHTVAVSASAVAIGLAALLVLPLPELRSIGAGGLLVTAVAALLACTLVPALLALLGPRLERGTVRGAGGGLASAPAMVARWHRWGEAVVRRPALVLLVAGAPVALLAWQATRLRTGLPRGDWLPARLESAEGVRRLRLMERDGVVQTVRVVLALPAGASAWDADAWAAGWRVATHLAADGRIDRVRALPLLAGPAAPSPTLRGLIPGSVVASFVSRDERMILVEAVPRPGVAPEDLSALVASLRASDARTLTGLRGATLLVGGLPAFNVDYRDAVRSRGLLLVCLVVGATALALGLAFRSVLVPLKAVALNLLSVAAAFGAVVLVFQDGWLLRLVGLAEPLDATFPAVWPIVFCIVFGLSIDYEVFLVARVAEARRAGLDEAAAIADGVARTGGVVTSAAAVMLVVFAAFALGDFVLMKILGVALATAIVVDATVVRLALGPALLALAGRWNWWPGERSAVRRAPAPPRAAPAPAPGP